MAEREPLSPLLRREARQPGPRLEGAADSDALGRGSPRSSRGATGRTPRLGPAGRRRNQPLDVSEHELERLCPLVVGVELELDAHVLDPVLFDSVRR